MRASSVIALATGLLAGSAVAKDSWAKPRDAFCLCDSDAEVIGNDFAQLISNYSAAFATEVLSDTYTDYSDSVISLIDSGGIAPIPLGSAVFASKAAFLAGQSSQPDVPFTILNTWHTCDTVIIRWVAHPGTQPVQGFDALVVVPSNSSESPQPYQITTTYGEFNSGAWLADLGRPECNTTSSK